MKTISTMIAATLLVASFGASAQTRTGTDTLTTQVAPTKEVAYQLGVNKLAQLNSISSHQLGLAINAPISNIEDDSLHLTKGGYVTTQERVDASGKKGYVGLVNVGFDYIEHEGDK